MNTSLKWQYLLTIFVLILTSVFLRSFYDYQKHNQALEEDIEQLGENAFSYYQDLQTALIERYLTLTHHYTNEPVIRATFQNRDRKSLYLYSQQDYARLQQDNPSLHTMHYFDVQNTTLLRLHQPENYDDDLTFLRPIVREANALKRPLQGFEVGKNGITYRISTPLIDRHKEHFGLLEFGIHPNYFVERLSKRFGVESMILVKSASLGTLIKNYHFQTLKDFSIIHKTEFFEPLLSSIDLSLPVSTLKVKGEYFLVLSHLDQLSHQGEVVAKIVIAKNITDLVMQNHADLIKANLVNFAVLIILFLLVYFIFNQYSHALLRSAQTIQHLNQAQDQLKNQANTDELTGLYNRRFFNEALKQLLKEQQQGSLYFFDIDHFKTLNDSYGHQAGDKVLIELANMMKSFFRQNDFLVRWGGEEFAVFVKDIQQDTMMHKAESFRTFVEQKITQNQPYPITISGGVTHIRPDDQVSSLVKRADDRLYQAKQTGRNRTIGASHENEA